MKAKKLIVFFLLCAYILGTIGGFGYAVYGGSWPIALGVVVLAAMASPIAWRLFKFLSN